MAKQSGSVLGFLAWFTAVVVSIVVGAAMTEKILMLPGWLGGGTGVGDWIVVIVGWIVLITTIISAIMALLRK